MWRGAFFPLIVLGLAVGIWVLAIAAAESDWYKITSESDFLSTKVTVKYFLTKATSQTCVGNTCATYTSYYNSTSSSNESDGEKQFRTVHTTTRAMIIIGILIDTFFILYLIALVLTSFMIRVEGIFKLYSKVLWVIGLILAGLTTAFVALSWLTYFGITKAFKEIASSPFGDCTEGPCKSFSGSDDGTSWGPGTGFALGIVCTALGGAAITIFFLRGKK